MSFALPEGNVHIAFSGGRTSAMMLCKLVWANPVDILSSRVKIIFTNTGREMDATLDFVQKVADYLCVEIIWLEYDRNEKSLYARVGHNSASRNGEPFEQLIAHRKYLPNQQQRFCTEELKIRTAKRYLRSLGWDKWTALLGMRADEPSRIKPKTKDRWVNRYPMYEAGLTKRDVMDFWKKMPFDLQLVAPKGNAPLGNCDGCFLKSEATIAMLAREYPERFAWWEKMEESVSGKTKKPDGAKFNKRYKLSEIRKFTEDQGDWIFDNESYLCQKSEGECF